MAIIIFIIIIIIIIIINIIIVIIIIDIYQKLSRSTSMQNLEVLGAKMTKLKVKCYTKSKSEKKKKKRPECTYRAPMELKIYRQLVKLVNQSSKLIPKKQNSLCIRLKIQSEYRTYQNKEQNKENHDFKIRVR